MGDNRPRTTRRLSAREADRLVAGRPTPADGRALARLLAAAAAPARPGELAAEAAAVEGFRLAYRSAPARRRLVPLLRRTVVIKLSVLSAVLFLGGTALAAGTGQLPASTQRSVHNLFSPLGVPAPHEEPNPAAGSARRGSAVTPGPAPVAGQAPGPPVGPVVRPSPDVAQLCLAYLGALARHQPPDPAIRRQLAAAAGDERHIVPFCARVPYVGNGPEGDRPGQHASHRPGRSGPP